MFGRLLRIIKAQKYKPKINIFSQFDVTQFDFIIRYR